MSNSSAVVWSFHDCARREFKGGNALKIPIRTGWENLHLGLASTKYGEFGNCGNGRFIKLCDGRIIYTNDRCVATPKWATELPSGAIVGHELATKVCQPTTKEALEWLLANVDSRFVIETAKTVKEAHSVHEKFNCSDSNKGFPQLPQCTERAYKTEKRKAGYVLFSSPCRAKITHFKVGNDPILPLTSSDRLQLSTVDPTKTSLFLLYHEFCTDYETLQKHDTIDEYHIHSNLDQCQFCKPLVFYSTTIRA